MKNSNIDTPETSAVSVSPDKLTLFYSKCHQHQTSTAYKARAFLMVDNIPNISPKAVSHIAYQFTVAVRTFVLKEKEAKYPLQTVKFLDAQCVIAMKFRLLSSYQVSVL
jgi:hypothetical protein